MPHLEKEQEKQTNIACSFLEGTEEIKISFYILLIPISKSCPDRILSSLNTVLCTEDVPLVEFQSLQTLFIRDITGSTVCLKAQKDGQVI